MVLVRVGQEHKIDSIGQIRECVARRAGGVAVADDRVCQKAQCPCLDEQRCVPEIPHSHAIAREIAVRRLPGHIGREEQTQQLLVGLRVEV